MDRTSPDYLEMLMQDYMRILKFSNARELNLCPVCNVYNKPEEHRCSTPTVKELV